MTIGQLMADLVARFVNIAPEDVDPAIVDTQRQVVLALHQDRSSFFQMSEDDDLAFTHHWTRPEYAHLPMPSALSAFSAAAHFPWYLAQLRAGAMVVVDDVDLLPSDVDRESLRRVGTRSNVAAPIFVGGKLFGALTVASLGTPRPVTQGLKDAVRLLGRSSGRRSSIAGISRNSRGP